MPPDRQHRRPPAPAHARAPPPAAERAVRVAGGVDAVRDDVGGDAVLALQRLRPVAADADAVVHVLDRRALALPQHGAGEVVDVVDRAHDRGQPPLGPQRQQRARREAVLGVVDVGGAGRAQPVGERRPRSAGCAAPRPLPGAARPAPGARGTRGGAEEGRAVGRQRPQLDVVAALAERLGERERVHHAAARLGRVGDDADPQSAAHPARAAASRAAAALVGARRAPGLGERRLLAAAHLRVVLGAQHVRDHRELGPLGERLADRRGERPGGVGVARVAQHHVEQQDARRAGRPPRRAAARRAPRGRSSGGAGRG